MKSGFVGLIGRPNVGKSTLMNSILGKKVAITSNKPQTTRNIIQGIYNEEDTQIIFVDTPGIHKPQSKLGKFLNEEAFFSINDVDVILFVTDVSVPLGKGDQYIINLFKEITTPVILVLNKIDKLPKEEILLKIDEYKDLYNFTEIVPISSIKKDNIDRLIEVLKKYLKDNIRYFDKNTYTSSPINFIISELIREKVFNLTEEEIPHTIATYIENIEDKNNAITINGVIVTDRENIKKIIIGKQGSMIKEIGTQARKDIESLLGKKVYLELFVKVIPKWRDKERYLKELGFRKSDFE